MTWESRTAPSTAVEGLAAEVVRSLEPPAVVGVAAVGPADAVATAVSLARQLTGHTGRSVLLVEATLREPSRLRPMFTLDPSPGFAALLARPSAASWARRSAEARTLVMPSGRYDGAAGGPFPGSRAVGAALDEIRARYDTSVVLAPPLDQGGDGYVVARACDRLVLVVQEERTSRALLTEAVERVGRERCLGAVLVAPPAEGGLRALAAGLRNRMR